MAAYCKETFNGTQSVINYLGKYIHRIAISNYRIKSMTEATVTYAVKDYKNEGRWNEKTVPGKEFIRPFLMHVPPNVLSESGTMVCCPTRTRAKR